MLDKTTFKAKFNGLNTNDGKCVLKFTLDPESFDKLPDLVRCANNTVNVDIYGDQTVLFVDSDTGEYLDDERVEDADAEPIEDEREEDDQEPCSPYELPPAAVDCEDAA